MGSWKNESVAIKVCKRENVAFIKEDFYFEVALMSVIHHPHILPCLGAKLDRDSKFFVLISPLQGSFLFYFYYSYYKFIIIIIIIIIIVIIIIVIVIIIIIIIIIIVIIKMYFYILFIYNLIIFNITLFYKY